MYQHMLTHAHFRDGGKEKYVDPSSQPLTPSKPSAEAFPLEHGRLRVGGALRTSRSYDLITDAVKEEEKEKERDGEQSQLASSHVHSYSLPYGASPRYGMSVVWNAFIYSSILYYGMANVYVVHVTMETEVKR